VVGGGHHEIQERLSFLMLLVGSADHFIENVLIADSPCIFKGDLAVCDIMPHCADAVAEHASAPAVINAEAVASEIGVHVVEIAVAAVKKAAVIVFGPEDIADGVEVLVFRPFDNRLSRGWRYAQCQRLHAAHGSGSGGVHAREKDALSGQGCSGKGVKVLPVFPNRP